MAGATNNNLEDAVNAPVKETKTDEVAMKFLDSFRETAITRQRSLNDLFLDRATDIRNSER